MATASWRKAADLTRDLSDELIREPRTFALGQALRLLAFLNTESPEAWRAFIEHKITIRSWLSLAFPSTEIDDLTVHEELTQAENAETEHKTQHRYTFTSTNFALYSTMGPLPTLYTEELLEEARRDESVSRDFLDILTNHLSHLRFAASLQNRLELRTFELENKHAAHIQFCLMGQGDPAFRTSPLPRTELTEIFARRSRSAAQLALYLGYALKRNDIRIEQCVERRASIPCDQRLCLGRANCRLGTDAMLGKTLRDSTGLFRIHFEQVSHEDMRTFLPGHPGYTEMVTHLGRFLDCPLAYELCLHPQAHTPPPTTLGATSAIGFYLGSPTTCLPVRVFWNNHGADHA